MNRQEANKVCSEVWALTKFRPNLRQHETLVKANISSESVTLLIETLKIRETTREIITEAKGQRLLAYTLVDGAWRYDQVECWDEDFKPEVFVKFGRRETVRETMDRYEWEALCNRPGTARSPMDNFTRTSNDGKYAAPGARKHWAITEKFTTESGPGTA